MKKEIIKIAIHSAFLSRLERLSKVKGITLELSIERAFALYIGSYLVSPKDRCDFQRKIAKVTYEKDEKDGN